MLQNAKNDNLFELIIHPQLASILDFEYLRKV